MVVALYIVALIILLPGTILVSALVVRRYGTPWRILGLGVLAFLVEEIIRNPVMSALSNTGFYQGLVNSGSSIVLVFIYAFSLALFQIIVRCGGLWAAFRFVGGEARPWGGGMAFSAGFSSIDAFLTFGFALLYTLLAVISITQAAAPPEGVSAQDFAAAQAQVKQFLNMSFFEALIQTQILSAISIFTLQFAVTMITWVGMVAKKWHWLVAGFLWQAALVSVYTVTTNWMNMYLANPQKYGLNLVLGAIILFFLMAVNLGLIYAIRRFATPLLGDAVKFVPPPAPAAVANKPATANAARPKEKPLEAPKPSKRLKNTDLK